MVAYTGEVEKAGVEGVAPEMALEVRYQKGKDGLFRQRE